MKQHSFMRLWSYLKVYKLSVIPCYLLKVVSIVMSVRAFCTWSLKRRTKTKVATAPRTRSR